MLRRFTKKWLQQSIFEYVEINEIKYPTQQTIINLHDLLIDCYSKEEDVPKDCELNNCPISY